jgi:predicted ArsR family transcriptional regulator
MATGWDQRFFTSTRGRILTLLRRASRTVDELAQELELTDNAVRAHLATLERDGLVQQRSARRGSGKPAYTYGLTPQAERLFPKAYELVLQHLLDTLNESLGPGQYEELLRAVGRRIAARHRIVEDGSESDLEARVQGAVSVLNEMGGLMVLERNNGSFYICGYSCPLSSLSTSHTELCNLVETLLTELVGSPVHQQCERTEALSCRFEITGSLTPQPHR